MQSDLDQLIEALEAEKKSLEKAIAEWLEEGEYLAANDNSRALGEVSRQLHVLHGFKGQSYGKSRELDIMKEMLKKMDDGLQSIWADEIAAAERELQKLREQKSRLLYDDQQIDDSLFKLHEGTYKRFELYLNKIDYFDVEIINGPILNISIKLSIALNTYTFHEDSEDPINYFIGLGFELNEAEGRLIYKYPMHPFNDAIEIKKLLSRIVYTLFYGNFEYAHIEFFL